MLSSLRTRTTNAFRTLGNVRRYSTPTETAPKVSVTTGAPRALRPHLNIPVIPTHGLYDFFRKREKDGKVIHDPYEDESGLQDLFGRAWSAAELRRKSFRDLHILWYVLVRERNLIATQREGYRRLNVARGLVANIEKRHHQCRKSMARIKYVINERRLAYEGAMKIHAEKVEQAAKEKRERVAKKKGAETERADSGADVIHQEEKVSPPVSEATQSAVDGLLQRSTT